MNDITDFVGIAIVGTALSLVQQWINKKWELNSALNRALILVLSLVVGIVYFVLRATTWWTTIIGVLAAASTVYAIFLKKPSTV
jgi:hypothetical protein